ncbi:MAG TPA: ABC transporter permease [Acetobacteraceae bacterium]|nr:ABC transporter permease [Acetobacteraceae bacterium]
MIETARLSTEQRDGCTVLAFGGRLDAASIGAIWRRGMQLAHTARGRPVRFDLTQVSYGDMSGAAFLAALEAAHGEEAELVGAQEGLRELLLKARPASQPASRSEMPRRADAVDIFGTAIGLATASIGFIGETAVAVVLLPRRHRMLRLPDLLEYVDQAGVRSLPLVLLLGYLIGLILAFQSAVPMRRFGADIFVANLVALSLLRELGPLLAAVILAGRTGSAFAAEIGTMKVNEEVAALTTMGLDPITMLVLPRILAAMLVMPVMTLALDIAGMLGMTTVMHGFGFPVVTIAGQVQNWVSAGDLYGGLFKAICFGTAVAAIGCRAGLYTGVGPRSVGLSATAAVVGGIVATVALDGVFALIFYRLNL